MPQMFVRVFLCSGILIVANLFGGPAMTQTIQQQKDCVRFTPRPVEAIIACSILIQTQRLPNGKQISPQMLAEMHFSRAFAYTQISDYERAIADYEKALPFLPIVATLDYINENKRMIHWVRYLKEIQDDNDHSNWSGSPFDGYWIAK